MAEIIIAIIVVGVLLGILVILFVATSRRVNVLVRNIFVDKLYARSFEESNDLLSIELPDTLTYIYEFAFSGCDNLQYNIAPVESIVESVSESWPEVK